jgi:glycosyltransferase involved in cell wall biosynthesis
LRVPVVVYVPLVDESARMGFGRGGQRDALVRHGYGNLPTAWLTITREQAEHLAGWAGIRRPILTLPNTVSRHVEELAGTATVRREAEPRQPLRVLVLGRIEPHQKALDLLLAFLETSESLRGQVHVSMVGDGPYADEVRRRMAASALLNELLSLHPWSDPVEVMASHDVLLIASRYEGVPLVMLEAMALGLPVVASDLPGIRAFLPPEVLFGAGDLQRAFLLIQQLLDTASRDAMIERNRQAFASRASGAAFTAAVYELTDRLQEVAAGETMRAAPAGTELKRTLEGHS